EIAGAAREDAARLLADAVGRAGTVRALFAATARDRGPADDALAAVTGSPYRGLAAFGEQDAALFFGREAATAQVLERMSRQLGGVGLLVVSGASGAGKSSLLRAGGLPRVGADGLAGAPGAASWPWRAVPPARAPLE